jgi:hypothetical protein
MPKRTTVVLDDKVYEKLIKESVNRYGTARNISKVLNDLVRKNTGGRGDILKLIYSQKLAKTSAREFEQFRKKLSTRLEN